MKIKLLASAFLALTTAGLSTQTPETIAKRGLPAEAMPFILDSHVYIQGVAMDTIPMSLIYDTGIIRKTKCYALLKRSVAFSKTKRIPEHPFSKKFRPASPGSEG